MPKVPPCSRNELIRKLRKLEFAGPFKGGNHSYMRRAGYRQIVPNPHGKDISSDLIKEILKQAGISVKNGLMHSNNWKPNPAEPEPSTILRHK